MRINIDSEFFSDKRITKLSRLCNEPRMMTEARLLHVFRLCYQRTTAFVTQQEIDLESEWDRGDFGELMRDALLAEEVDAGVFRIFGVDERIQFLKKKSEAGKESAMRRKAKYGSAQPNRWKKNAEISVDQNPNTCSDGVRKNPNTSEPLTLTQYYINNKKIEITKDTNASRSTESPPDDSSRQAQLFPVAVTEKKKPVVVTPKNNAVPVFIAAYVTAWQARYPGGGRPDLGGAVLGQIKRFLADRTIDDAVNLIQVFCQLDDPWFLTKCHDFETFKQNVTKVSAAFASGKKNPGKKDWYELYLKQEQERAERNATKSI